MSHKIEPKMPGGLWMDISHCIGDQQRKAEVRGEHIGQTVRDALALKNLGDRSGLMD